MDLFTIFGWLMTMILTVTVPWPLTIPIMALAYRVRRGSEPVDLAPAEFWFRSTLASLGLAFLSLAVILLAYLLTVKMGLAAGATLAILFALYLPAAVGHVFWMFGLEEMIDGLSVFLLALLLPALPLLLLGWLLGLWPFLAERISWIVPA